MGNSKYTQVKVIPGPVISAESARDRREYKTQIMGDDESELNSYMAKGWVLIDKIEHHGRDLDVTSVAFVIGWPAPDEDD